MMLSCYLIYNSGDVLAECTSSANLFVPHVLNSGHCDEGSLRPLQEDLGEPFCDMTALSRPHNTVALCTQCCAQGFAGTGAHLHMACSKVKHDGEKGCMWTRGCAATNAKDLSDFVPMAAQPL